MNTKLLLVITLFLLYSCACDNKPNCNIVENGSVVKIEVAPLTSEAISINLANKFDVSDSFDLDILSPNYRSVESFKVAILPHNDDIIKAERIIHYYPTIWCNTVQFVYLFSLGYNYVQELEVKDGYIYFSDETDILNNKDFIKHFATISRQDIIDAIKEIPDKYKNTNLLYYGEDWSKDLPLWLKYADRYKSGDFINDPNEPFDISPEKEEIKVYYKIDGKELVKSFYTIHIVGN